jgi:capsular polysaccharide biosynthesis protein
MTPDAMSSLHLTSPAPAAAAAAAATTTASAEKAGRRTERHRAVRSRSSRRRRIWLRRLFPAWLRRRAWLLAICVLVGSVAGIMLSATSSSSYTAVATLAVPTGASGEQTQTVTGSTVVAPATPGDAYQAQQLAINYAAIIRNDNGLLTDAVSQLDLPLDTLTQRLSVSVETGTAVVLLGYTAPTKADAVRGVNAIASNIVKAEHSGSVIPKGTLSVVQLATSASGPGVFNKYGFEIGFLLGLLLGCILVLVAERIDPRADAPTDIAPMFAGSVAAVPSELSLPEFGHAILSSSPASDGVTLAPLRWWDVPATRHIEQTLVEEFPGQRVLVSTSIEEGMAHRLSHDAPVVLIVRSGEQLRVVGDALERLRLVGTTPHWIALLDRDDLYA